mmetsp:Transcript_13656/g.22527  ORF Transcript_13656/g.22527 Transcript_13656/m.22527 type:complete len:135 (+) Transcript_13656:405-809(+)
MIDSAARLRLYCKSRAGRYLVSSSSTLLESREGKETVRFFQFACLRKTSHNVDLLLGSEDKATIEGRFHGNFLDCCCSATAIDTGVRLYPSCVPLKLLMLGSGRPSVSWSSHELCEFHAVATSVESKQKRHIQL